MMGRCGGMNLLGIPREADREVVLISLLALIVLLVMRKALLLFCFDPTHVRLIGLHTGVLPHLLLALLSLTAIAGLQTVGITQVLAMLVPPGATGYLLSDPCERMAVLAIHSAVASSVAGIYWSYRMEASTAGCLVLVQTLLFLLCFLLEPRHGLLAQRRRSPRAPRFPSA